MRKILAIAQNTFRQTIRDKILYGILIFALIFIGSTFVLGSLTVEEGSFVIRSLGLAGIYIFGLIITLFLGGSLLYDEVEKRTTHIILSKPISRTNFIIGKFLGLLASISLTVLLMTFAYVAVVLMSTGIFDYMSLSVVLIQLLEFALIISVLMLLSVITTPLAATIYTVLLIYVGHFSGMLLSYAHKTGGIAKILLIPFYYLLPNLEKFNIRDSVVHKASIIPSVIIWTVVYAISYTTVMIWLSKISLSRKDL